MVKKYQSLFLIFCLLLTGFLSGCGSVAKQVDPYYGDLPCQGGKNQKISCMSLEQAYEQATENPSEGMLAYEEPPPRKGRAWKGMALGALGGAAIGAGIGALSAEGDDKIVERNLPGGGKFYEVVKKDADRVTAALVGAAVGVGAGAVLGYLVEKIIQNNGKIDSKTLEVLHERAQKYEKCVRDAARLEKEKGPEAAAKAAEKCGTILAGLPGVNLFDSKQISTYFRLKKEEQSRVKKALSAELLDKNITPLRTPPTIVRVFVTPWVDENDVFHQGETLFVVVNEGSWVIPGKKTQSRIKIIKPLKGGLK